MKLEEQQLHEQLKQKSEMYRKMLDLQLKQRLVKRHNAEYGVVLKKLVEMEEEEFITTEHDQLQLEGGGVLELPPATITYKVQ
jgi:hypothetical protein